MSERAIYYNIISSEQTARDPQPPIRSPISIKMHAERERDWFTAYTQLTHRPSTFAGSDFSVPHIHLSAIN